MKQENMLGSAIDLITNYFTLRYPDSDIKNLKPFLITRGHYHYWLKYKHLLKQGIIEIGNPSQVEGTFQEALIELAPKVYLAFSQEVSRNSESLVVGFAENQEALKPYLLNEMQGHAFIIDDYDYTLRPYELKSGSTVFLNDNIQEEFKADVTSFLNNGEVYRKLPSYKRGALLYGAPGNGKTSLSLWAAHLFDKVIVVPPEYASPGAAKQIAAVTRPEESKLIIIEDIDALQDNVSDMLNFIDGVFPLNKVYFIATTNYPEKLQENVLSRPSRFDLFLEITRPNSKTRRAILQHWLPELSKEELEKSVKLTEDLNASYFQEIFILHHTTKLSIEEIIEKCRSRTKLAKSKNFDKKEKVGFGDKGNDD